MRPRRPPRSLRDALARAEASELRAAARQIAVLGEIIRAQCEVIDKLCECSAGTRALLERIGAETDDLHRIIAALVTEVQKGPLPPAAQIEGQA